jgi:hypothetical protein
VSFTFQAGFIFADGDVQWTEDLALKHQVRTTPVSAQKLGQLQPFIAVFPQECMGQLASFGPT